MTDVYCPVCREPWEAYYLLNDLPYEVVSSETVDDVVASGRKPLQSSVIRERLEDEGWRFAGDSLVAIKQCSCCKGERPEGMEDDGRAEAVEMLADLLGDDEDGIASMMEDMEMMDF